MNNLTREELEIKVVETESQLIAYKLQYDMLRERFNDIAVKFKVFDTLPELKPSAKYTFEEKHHAELPELMYVDVDSAGVIVKAELVSRILGHRVDVTTAVNNCVEVKKSVMEEFYSSEKEAYMREKYNEAMSEHPGFDYEKE